MLWPQPFLVIMKKGFTLLELIIVIIIIGILATLGFTQYERMVERGRSAEARTILGQIRQAQVAYYAEYGLYAIDSNFTYLGLPNVDCAQQNTHYFSYSLYDTYAVAARCSTGALGGCENLRGSGGGKPPASSIPYVIGIDYKNGTFGGTAGFY